MAVCIPDRVVIDGASATNDTNDTVKEYQQSRQFKLRAVLYSPCGEESLLVTTTAQWTAVPHATVAFRSATTPKTVKFSTTSKELVVPSNKLSYGTYSINTVIVSRSQINIIYNCINVLIMRTHAARTLYSQFCMCCILYHVEISDRWVRPFLHHLWHNP